MQAIINHNISIRHATEEFNIKHSTLQDYRTRTKKQGAEFESTSNDSSEQVSSGLSIITFFQILIREVHWREVFNKVDQQ